MTTVNLFSKPGLVTAALALLVGAAVVAVLWFGTSSPLRWSLVVVAAVSAYLLLILAVNRRAQGTEK